MYALFLYPDKASRTTRGRRTRGFSMTELLVVISIIVVLAGILLVAMKGVRTRAKYAQTEETIRSFSAACDEYQIDNGEYPGAIPENLMNAQGGPAFSRLTSTENGLLALNGGFRVRQPLDTAAAQQEYDNYAQNETTLEIDFGSGWRIKIARQRIGEGPLIKGKPLGPYFSGDIALSDDEMESSMIPEIEDAWGQPIVYVRRNRPAGPLVGPPPSGSDVPPQFLIESMRYYTTSSRLGEMKRDQGESILNNSPDEYATFAQLIRHPAFGDPLDPINGQGRGAYVLFSAGPDGVYFSRFDGPGTKKEPVDDIVTNGNSQYNSPKVAEEYDDVLRFGGG